METMETKESKRNVNFCAFSDNFSRLQLHQLSGVIMTAVPAQYLTI